MEYLGCEIEIAQNYRGWYYVITKGGFTASCGPFIGPESAEASAKLIIDVLDENIQF